MAETKRTRAHIERDVFEELQADTRLMGSEIGATVDGSTVILAGTAESWSARLAAEQAAHRVVGVCDVINNIQVALSSSLERSDADVEQAVRHALEWDVRVPHENIRASVASNVVTLEGTVAFWGQREDAAKCVLNLAGVREVRNAIVVDPPVGWMASHAVRNAIEQALERHAEHASKRLRVTVEDGQVVLSGDVRSWTERRAVERAVHGVPGVRTMDSQLRVRL